MKPSPMTCRHALETLLADSNQHSRTELLQARLHTAECPRCRAVYDPTELGVDTLGELKVRHLEPARTLRLALLVCAVSQLVLAIPWLFGRSLLPDADVAVSHLTRDGAFGLVVAALGLVTVWRPRYAASTAVIGFVVLVLQIVAGIADRDANAVTDSFEAVHLLVIAIVVLLFCIAVDLARRATPVSRPRRPALRSRSSHR